MTRCSRHGSRTYSTPPFGRARASATSKYRSSHSTVVPGNSAVVSVFATRGTHPLERRAWSTIRSPSARRTRSKPWARIRSSHHGHHVVENPERPNQQVQKVLQKRRLLVLVDAVPDELEDPSEDEEGDVDPERNPRAGEVERRGNDQHDQREPPFEGEVDDLSGDDQSHRRIDVPDSRAREHADQGEHDERDA